MRLFGRDITPAKVMTYVAERLEARGLAAPRADDVGPEGVEARVDPLSFNLQALEANADATVGLPLETHRGGVAGRAVVLAKRAFRAAGQVFINEALGRQRVFNGHVRDSYAQLAAEVIRLRKRVAELEGSAPERGSVGGSKLTAKTRAGSSPSESKSAKAGSRASRGRKAR